MISRGATMGSTRVVRFGGNATAAGNIASEGGIGERAVKTMRVNVSAMVAWVGVLPKLCAARVFLS